MSSKIPIVRQLNWWFAIPQFIILILLISLINLQLGSLIYLFLVFILRYSIARHHMKGLKYLKKGLIKDALIEHKKSYEFFTKYIWIDKYRCITIFSASDVSYREMALLNIAYCYMQMNNGYEAIAYYKKTLAKFPNSIVAQNAIKTYELFRGM